MESKSLTKPNPHAWPLIGRNMASVTGCSRNTAPAPPTTSCCKQGCKITLVGSRFTHDAESRYAPIKGEALAMALDKAQHFVLGCKNLTIAVDLKPLLKIVGDRSLDHINNTRLRNLKEKILQYHFKICALFVGCHTIIIRTFFF